MSAPRPGYRRVAGSRPGSIEDSACIRTMFMSNLSTAIDLTVPSGRWGAEISTWVSSSDLGSKLRRSSQNSPRGASEGDANLTKLRRL
ncbi:hypothetical protein AVEN_101639-1 [Araneus ventricosus]|uniref:Uncharacterized protein n=1 Tax=Araneus ventricosus TaxID=182803 RepID=A0A4Y2EWR5_ARAVE|nr:hypothetical protein AVEN_101639-1 [Araneus ventricosus]